MRTYLPGQEEHQGKQDADDPGAHIDLLDLAGEDLHEHIGDQAEGDTIGDVVGQGHERHGDKAGHGSGGIVPGDVADVGHHQHAHINQGRGAGVGGDQLGHGGEEHGDEEHHRSSHRGKTGAAALGHAGRGLHEGGDGGGAADSAGAGSAGISQHGPVHIGNVAVLIQHVAGRAGAVQGAQGVEHIHHAEGQHGGQQHHHESAGAVGGNEGGEVKAGLEHRAEGLGAEIAEGAEEVGGQVGGDGRGIEAGNGDQTHHIIHHGSAQDAPQHRTADLLLAHGADGEHGQQSDQHGEDGGPGLFAGEHVEGVQVHAGGGIVDHDAGILQADEGDEQADTGGDGRLDLVGDGVEDDLAQTGNGQQHEDDAVKQHQHQGVGIAQAQAHTHGVDKIGVQAHSGGLRQRQIGQQADEQGAHHGGNGGGHINGPVADAQHIGAVAKGVREHTGIDHQNVGHGHKGGDTGHDLRPDGGALFGYMEEAIHKLSPFISFPLRLPAQQTYFTIPALSTQAPFSLMTAILREIVTVAVKRLQIFVEITRVSGED